MLLKRSDTYYFRWQLPADLRPILGVSELIRSLHTNDKLTATSRAVKLKRSVDRIKRIRTCYKMKELNESTYHTLLEQLWRDADSLGFEPPETIDDLEFLSELVKADLTFFRQAAMTETGNYDTEKESPREWLKTNLQRELNDRGITEIDESVFEKLLTDYMDIHIHRTQKQLDSLDPNQYKPKLPAFLQPKPTSSTPSNREGSSLLLSEAWRAFVNDKQLSKKWTRDKLIAEREAQFRDFLEVLEEDIPVSQVTRDTARTVLNGLIKFPVNRRKKYGATPLKDIPPTAQTLTSSSVNQRMTNISEFFKWLVTEDHILKNPFEGINVDANKKSYATYTNDDLTELFNLDKQRIMTPWQFWIPRVALYTGARQNEIAQLLKSDVIKDSDTGIYYFSINDNDVEKHVKSKSARRKVPIHNDLLDNGFIDYLQRIKGKGATSLWPDLNTKGGSLGQTVSQYWRRLKQVHNIPSKSADEQGRAKVFHSLRRVVINRLRNAGVDITTVQGLVGHEPSMLGETYTYLDEIPLQQLFTSINKLEIEDISWNQP